MYMGLYVTILLNLLCIRVLNVKVCKAGIPAPGALWVLNMATDVQD